MKITRIPRTIRNLSRVYEIMKVVAKYGFDDVVGRIGLEGSWDALLRKISFGRFGQSVETERLSTEERIRKIFEDLGSTYIKFGQILATRPDLIPMSLVRELRKLHDDVPPFESTEARAAVESELGAGIDEIFKEFTSEPIAAASIAQVHKAVLLNGDEVVIKIQRPGLRKRINSDLELLHTIAQLIEEHVPELRRWQPVAIVDEFDRSIHKEIDFGREAHNIQKFARCFEGDPEVYAPRVYEDLSTDRILTMEFINGVKFNAEEILAREDLDRKIIATRGTRVVIEQIFVHGFFHGDPHPGNVFVMDGNVICLLDFGLMGNLDQERIDDLLVFLVSVLTNNPERMIRGFMKQGLIDETVEQRQLRSDIADLMDRYIGVEVQKINVPMYIQALFDVITRHHIVLPADLLLMGKSLATIDGLTRDIYPEMDPFTAIRPQILQIYFRRLTDPEFYTRETRRSLEEAAFFLQRLPQDLRVITRKLRDGRLTVRWSPEGPLYEQMLQDRNRASNRLAAAVAIVGLAAVSSFLLVATVNLPGFQQPVASPTSVAAVSTADPSGAGAETAAVDGAVTSTTAVARHASTSTAIHQDVRLSGEMTTLGVLLKWLGILGYVAAAFLGLGFLFGLFRSGGQ